MRPFIISLRWGFKPSPFDVKHHPLKSYHDFRTLSKKRGQTVVPAAKTSQNADTPRCPFTSQIIVAENQARTVPNPAVSQVVESKWLMILGDFDPILAYFRGPLF